MLLIFLFTFSRSSQSQVGCKVVHAIDIVYIICTCSFRLDDSGHKRTVRVLWEVLGFGCDRGVGVAG